MPGTRESEEARKEQILHSAFEVASRRGLSGMTIRRVAEEAGLSAGLVLFHFTSKRRLLEALLERLLETTTVLHIDPETAAIPNPLARLRAIQRREMVRLTREPKRLRVFFEFWMAGMKEPAFRRKIRVELDRYREAFRPLVVAILENEDDRYSEVTADGLAAVAVSFIKGCAVQSLIDPEHFDIHNYLIAADALLAQLATG